MYWIWAFNAYVIHVLKRLLRSNISFGKAFQILKTAYLQFLFVQCIIFKYYSYNNSLLLSGERLLWLQGLVRSLTLCDKVSGEVLFTVKLKLY